jgi:hypothetical protein
VEALQSTGEAVVVQPSGGGMRTYRLTPYGQSSGESELRRLDNRLGEYIKSMAGWVRSLSFQQLVKAVYDKYPEMKVNSVFQQ